MTHIRFETRTHETHPPFSWTYTIYTHAPWRARKNIYERLIGILVHSNNCCAHYLTNKNHIGNKCISSPLIITTILCSLPEESPSLTHTSSLFATRGSPNHPKTLPPTTTETQSYSGQCEGTKKVVSEVPTTHSAQSSRIPHPIFP